MPEVVDVLRFQDEISNQTSLPDVPGECAPNTTTIDIVCGMGVARSVARAWQEGWGGCVQKGGGGCVKKGGEGVARRVGRVCEEGWGGCVKKGGEGVARRVERVCEKGWGGCVKKGGE